MYGEWSRATRPPTVLGGSHLPPAMERECPKFGRAMAGRARDTPVVPPKSTSGGIAVASLSLSLSVVFSLALRRLRTLKRMLIPLRFPAPCLPRPCIHHLSPRAHPLHSARRHRHGTRHILASRRGRTCSRDAVCSGPSSAKRVQSYHTLPASS